MNQGNEITPSDSYHQHSNWLFQENMSSSIWTTEENKIFEKALALYDTDTPDRWIKVAAMIPSKTIDDVKQHYRELEEDVSDIEAGLIPIPGYTNGNGFTLDWIDNQGYEGLKDYYSPGKGGSATRSSDQERKKGVPWSEEEHRQFLLGLQKYGKGDWRNISRNFVTSRTPTQVASHAQKYFIRQVSGGKDKRRSSIHDITTANLQEPKSPSPEKNRPLSPVRQLQPKMFSIDWKPPCEGVTPVYNVPPSCGISTYGPQSQQQNRSGYQFRSFDTVIQMQHQ